MNSTVSQGPRQAGMARIEAMTRLGYAATTTPEAIARKREHLRQLGYEVPPPRRAGRDDPGLWDGVTSEGRTDGAPQA